MRTSLKVSIGLAFPCVLMVLASCAPEERPGQASLLDASWPAELAKGFHGWRRAVTKADVPANGCFQLTYPSTQWVEEPCGTPPSIPQQPARAPASQTVGNGNDFMAGSAAGNIISWAEGSFPLVSGVTTEHDNGAANDYTLQLNTQRFNTSSCSGAADPTKCLGWQQFIYQPGSGYMQYWLITYNNKCPSGWRTFKPDAATIDCWRNSPGSVTVGGAPITSLGSMTLTGKAGSSDSVIVSVGGGRLNLYSTMSLLNLSAAWNAAEFNIVGDGNGSDATFDGQPTITAQLVTDVVGTTNADTCLGATNGGTGETNNLKLGACSAAGGDLPGIVFTESFNGSGGLTAPVAVPAALGYEQVRGDFNGDNVEDMIIVNASGSYEYLGKRSGAFTANAWTRNDLVLGAVTFVPGDFNGDFITDLMIVTGSGTFEYLGQTSGGFKPDVFSRTDLKFGQVSYVAGDFNGDRVSDLLVVTSGGTSEFLGKVGAAGGFTANVWSRTDLPLGQVSYVPGDFNGDTFTDLIIVTPNGSFEYLGQLSGGFTAFSGFSRSDLPLGRVSYTVGDFDGNGIADLIIVTPGGSFEYVGLNPGGFAATTWTQPTLSLGQVTYVPGDFNGDGATDLIIVTASGSYEYTGLLTNGFKPNVWTESTFTNYEATYLARDFDGDGKTDFVVQTPQASYEYTGKAIAGFNPSVWVREDLNGRATTAF